MPAQYYKVAEWGGPVGEGVSDAKYISVSGIAKTNLAAEPHIIANELICARLGAALGLPIPPCFLVSDGDTSWFVSMNFNLSGEPLPPVRPAEFVQELPELSAGLLLFDIWVLNPDRHAKNVQFDRFQKRANVFDHSRALMPKDFEPRWFAELCRDGTAIDHGTHFLRDEISDGTHLGKWSKRIAALPEFIIRDAVQGAVGAGLDATDVDFFVGYLIERAGRLPEIVETNISQFPRLSLGLGGSLLWS